MPENAVYVGRPSKWGNPWTPDNAGHITVNGMALRSRTATVAECVEMYRDDVRSGGFGYKPADVRMALRGKDLACWCPLDSPCHADVLLEMANGKTVGREQRESE